jgi:hypothetical protein
MYSQPSMQTVVSEDVAPALRTGETQISQVRTVGSKRTTGTMKLSINVAEDLGSRLRTLAFNERVSESSIVEVALALFYEAGDDEALAELLRSRGASLRRKRS